MINLVPVLLDFFYLESTYGLGPSGHRVPGSILGAQGLV